MYKIDDDQSEAKTVLERSGYNSSSSSRWSALLAGMSLIASPLVLSGQLEEIVVTAQKRQESLQDVPVSVSVTQGEHLDDFSLTGLEALAGTLPNVTIAENATQDSVTIRAIGSGANHGFEQSVGTFVDGVYFGRGRSSRAPFLDVERVEILKGPQGVLFGKNTIAGALNITTRKPGDEFEGSIAAEYFDGDESYAITGVLSGPISNSVGGRLVLRKRESDGYVSNASGPDGTQKDESFLRGILTFDVNDALDITIKAEASRFDQEGRHLQLVEAGPRLANYQSVDPNFEQVFDFNKSVNNPVFGPDFDNTDAQNISATVNYSFGDLMLVGITSYVGYEYNNNIPANFSAGIETASKLYDEEHSQFSQELRLQSDTGGAFEYIIGIFYQSEEIDHLQFFDFDTAQGIADGFPLPPFIGRTTFDILQETDSIAVFGQGTWNISDRLSATLGVRYTDDEKDMDFLQSTTGMLPFPNRSIIDSRSDSDVTPSVTVEFHASDDIMLYASFAQGFKSGGFDFESATQFEEETVDAWEIGMKSTLADGAVELNVSVFSSEFDDLQTAAWNGQAFVTGNAAAATTEGIEIDGRWQITDTLRITGAVAFLNAEYDDFPGAVCNANQQVAFGAATGMNPNTCQQDLSGQPLQFAADYAGNLNLEYDKELSDSLNLSAVLGLEFSDSYFTALDLDPISEQDSFVKLNARVELAGQSGWSVALVGKNLTDEKTTTWVNDVPFFRGAFFGSIDPPRSIGVQGRYEF